VLFFDTFHLLPMATLVGFLKSLDPGKTNSINAFCLQGCILQDDPKNKSTGSTPHLN